MTAFVKDRDRAIARLSRTIRRKKWKTGQHFYLDLRAKGFRGGEPVIRDPAHPQWPDRGRAARARSEAEAWLIQYVDRLGPKWFTEEVQVLVTVEDYGNAYLEDLGNWKGRDSSTYKNRSSHLRNHIYPVLGSHRLRALDHRHVQQLMDGLRSTRDGAPLKMNPKSDIYLTLGALWKLGAPQGEPPPWKGKVRLESEDPARRRRLDAKAGIRPNSQRGVTIDHLRPLLVAAMMEDLQVRGTGLKNLADVMAFNFYHPVRIEEISFLRGFDFHVDLRAVHIPGTKSESADRYCPTQVHYEPWRDRLLAGLPCLDAFLFPTSGAYTLPGVSTYQRRISGLLLSLGLKQKGESTHIFRSIFMSQAHGSQLKGTTISLIGGHVTLEDPLFGEHYNQWPTFLEALPEEAYNIMPNLGSPDEIEDEARFQLRKEGIRVPT